MFGNFEKTAVNLRYAGDCARGVRERYTTVNARLNVTDYCTELIYYKKPLTVLRKGVEEENPENVSHLRNFAVCNGTIVPISDAITFLDYVKNRKRSRLRALNQIYSYVLANEFRYFVTLTFSPEKVNRDSSDDCIAAYGRFRERLQYYFPDSYIFAVPEYHPTSGKLHIHALVGGCDLGQWLSPAFYSDSEKNRAKDRVGQPIYSTFGDRVYNLDLYDYGFSTLIDIGESCNRMRIANYIGKYMAKSLSMPYNKRSYYHTHNILPRESYLAYLDEGQLFDALNAVKLYDDVRIERAKDNEKMIVYRVFQNIDEKIGKGLNSAQNSTFANK